jgi:acetyl esterase/lipase/short-subunit dehydrogenase
MALDRRIAAMMWLLEKSGNSFDPNVSVEVLRAKYLEANKRFGLKETGGIDSRDVTFPASDGATIGARLYRPTESAGVTLPVLVYFHGGGWVIGDVEGYDGLMRFVAREGRFAVLSVEYRLGPEHPFPRGHEDAFDAYAWLLQNAAGLGLDPARVAVGGDSAGGSLAAAICNYAEARDLARPAYAFLIYPSVDGTGRFPSRAQYTGNLPLTPTGIEWFKKHSTRDPAELSDPLFVTLDAPHPERHPPAYVLAAQYDPLVDEGRAYFERLRDAGVSVVYDLRATLPHGFISFAGVVPEAKRALVAGVDATAVALGTRPAKVAALTGAGSGIGRALAIELANNGYALALADRDERGLSETARMVADRTTISTHVLDVAERAAVEAFAADVLRAHGRVDVAINNAGVGLAGNVAEVAIEEIAWLMDINFWGTVYGVKAFLPALLRSPGGTIVNISSAFGLIAPPGQAAYAASKFAVRGFSESLREELRGKVHVVTVHPGGIKTNIARSSRIAAGADQEYQRRRTAAFDRRMLTQSPEKAARYIMRGILRKSDRVLIGADAMRVDALSRILGPGAARVIAKQTAGRSGRRARSTKKAATPV